MTKFPNFPKLLNLGKERTEVGMTDGAKWNFAEYRRRS
jgi:hypothetical protein